MRLFKRIIMAWSLTVLTVGGAALAQAKEDNPEIKVGHLYGICMSPLFYADAMGYFKEQGLNVKLTLMPNPGDSITALVGRAIQLNHNPFTTSYIAAEKGSPIKIISGSGSGGLVVIAQPETGLKSMKDLKEQTKAGKRFKVGSQRMNTLELTFFRLAANEGMGYDDFDMVWTPDHFAMVSTFETKSVDIVTHVEPFATKLTDKSGGVRLGDNVGAWGQHAPDCVVSVHEEYLKKYPESLRKYIDAILHADMEIKKDPNAAAEILDKGKYYKVDLATLKAALPRQPPQVDLTGPGAKAMQVAVDDMVKLGYLKKEPKGVVDFTLLEKVKKGSK